MGPGREASTQRPSADRIIRSLIKLYRKTRVAQNSHFRWAEFWAACCNLLAGHLRPARVCDLGTRFCSTMVIDEVDISQFNAMCQHHTQRSQRSWGQGMEPLESHSTRKLGLGFLSKGFLSFSWNRMQSIYPRKLRCPHPPPGSSSKVHASVTESDGREGC